MISAYHSIVSYDGYDWNDYLTRICVYDIFKELLSEYPDKNDFTSAVKYIMSAYSVESDMVIIGSDWLSTKKRIFEKYCLKDQKKLYSDLVHLKNGKVLNAIQKWLDFQQNDVWTQLSILKDLRVEMQVSCLTDIKKASGETDYDQKYKNAQYSVDIKKMIKDLESELIQSSMKLKDAVKEFRSERSKSTFGIETMLKEEQNGVGA